MDQNKDLQLVIGLIQVEIEPWSSIFTKGQKETWMKELPKGVQVVNLFGKRPSRLLIKLDQIHEKYRFTPWSTGLIFRLDKILTPFLRFRKIPSWTIVKDGMTYSMRTSAPSTYLTQVTREFSLFEYFLKFTDAKYLYMTNTSSYVNFKQLMLEISELPPSKVYGGSVLPYSDYKFTSGANRIFSRDIIEVLVERFSKIDYRLLNDVAIGELLKNEPCEMVGISSKSFETIDAIKQADLSEINQTAHFRLKSGVLKSRNDSNLMHTLNQRLF